MMGQCDYCRRTNQVLKRVTVRIGGPPDDPEHEDYDICVDRFACETRARYLDEVQEWFWEQGEEIRSLPLYNNWELGYDLDEWREFWNTFFLELCKLIEAEVTNRR